MASASSNGPRDIPASAKPGPDGPGNGHFPAGAQLVGRVKLNGDYCIYDEAEDAPLLTIVGHNGVSPAPLCEWLFAVFGHAVRVIEAAQKYRDAERAPNFLGGGLPGVAKTLDEAIAAYREAAGLNEEDEKHGA